MKIYVKVPVIPFISVGDISEIYIGTREELRPTQNPESNLPKRRKIELSSVHSTAPIMPMISVMIKAFFLPTF